jgi:dTDP-4-amino-4,6-dideoxygalactose transaminase
MSAALSLLGQLFSFTAFAKAEIGVARSGVNGPLICGSINEHPFWYERYGKQDLPISKKVHEYGLYLPNNHQMTVEEIDKVINIVNQYV